MLDVAIIGGGPAGLSAAINAVQRNKSVKIFGRKVSSSLLFTAEKVDNYLGIQNISGEEILNTFLDHALEKGVEFYEGRVLQIFPMDDYFVLNVENEMIEAKTVIITIGLNKSKTIENEEKYIGKGVSYCATCDGMLYKNKKVMVIGEIEEAYDEANFLSEICSEVYFVPIHQFDKELNDKIKVLNGRPSKVLGNETNVYAVEINDKVIECDGVFFIKETLPLNSIIGGLELEDNSIKVDRNMQTNIPKVFAAGDCTGRPYQISKAVGEGLVAAQQAVKFV